RPSCVGFSGGSFSRKRFFSRRALPHGVVYHGGGDEAREMLPQPQPDFCQGCLRHENKKSAEIRVASWGSCERIWCRKSPFQVHREVFVLQSLGDAGQDLKREWRIEDYE